MVDQPKRWAKVAHYKSPSGASTVAKKINERKVRLVLGGWEAVGRKNPAGGSDLYVRYLGERESRRHVDHDGARRAAAEAL